MLIRKLLNPKTVGKKQRGKKVADSSQAEILMMGWIFLFSEQKI
jgi:hypothetical protein